MMIFTLLFYMGYLTVLFVYKREQQSLYTLWNQWQAWHPIWGYWPRHAILHWYTYYVENMKCDYYFEDAFNKKICSIETNKLSSFHQNIKSLPKHVDDFELYINSLDIKFSFIGLSETWLDKAKREFYDLPGYYCINRYRENRRGGGVFLHIREGILFFILLVTLWWMIPLTIIKS